MLKTIRFICLRSWEMLKSQQLKSWIGKSNGFNKWPKSKRKIWTQLSMPKDSYLRNKGKKLSCYVMKKHIKLRDCMKLSESKRKLSKWRRTPCKISSMNSNRNSRILNFKTRRNLNYSKLRWLNCMKETSRPLNPIIKTRFATWLSKTE